MTEVGILIALGGGVLSFLSPCVLPLVPAYLSFVTGMSLEELETGADRSRALTYALLFVAGFSLVFVLLGASASFLGQFFYVYRDWMARVGGVVILILGLHLMGVFRFLPLLREARWQVSNRPVGYIGAVGVGIAFGAGWTPCIGPVLAAIIGLAAVQETVWQGIGLLSAYSTGLAIPFLVTAVGVEWFLAAFGRFRRYLPWIERGSGLLLVLIALLLITGSFTDLTAWLVPFTPDFLYERI